MNYIWKSLFCLTIILTLLQCRKDDIMMPPQDKVSTLPPVTTTPVSSTLPEIPTPIPTPTPTPIPTPTITNVFYVSTTGSDSGDGKSKPWRTISAAIAKIAGGEGNTISLSAGTFIESGAINVPTGINIIGAGKDQTIIKGSSSFFYHPSTPGYNSESFLIRLSSDNATSGNQILKDFTIDGDGKQLHGGIYVRYRNNILVENVAIRNTNFTAMWLWDTKNSTVKNVSLTNCSWGSNSYSSGALNLGNIDQLEIDKLYVDENTGYGVKAIGPGGSNKIAGLKIHDSQISVNPNGLWNGGSAPNIAIELWSVSLSGCEIYNTYVDNTISLVNSDGLASTGKQTIRVHHNFFDMETRSGGSGYGLELSIHDTEVDHNYFLRGSEGIANWADAMTNWSIHHNMFYGIQAGYPGQVIRSQAKGLSNLKAYNNTVEFFGTITSNFLGLYGGPSSNVEIKNNLIINNNTSYNWYQNSLIHVENGATIQNLEVKNNLTNNLAIGSVPGTYANNLTVDAMISKSGSRSTTYYMPLQGSPLINAGTYVGFNYVGSGPDIGAQEYGVGPFFIPSLNK